MKQVNLRIYRMILPLLMGLFLSVGVYAQNITVKGHVKDATGLEVIGANIVEKGNTSNGTITDLDGNFTLSVPKGATLTISFIGYQTQEVAAAPMVMVTPLLSSSGLIAVTEPVRSSFLVRPYPTTTTSLNNSASSFSVTITIGAAATSCV